MLSKKLSLTDIANKIKNKRILVRVDFNVPMKEGKITDQTRIKESIKTIAFCKDNGAKSIILMSHLGRPDGNKNEKYSLKPVSTELSKLINSNVTFLNDCIGPEVKNRVLSSTGGEVILLENLRFYAAEEGSRVDSEKVKTKEKPEVIKQFRNELSQLGDIYVNDAFGTCHRAHSSIVGCSQDLKVAGFLLKKELDYFSKVIEKPNKPLLVILGGAKVKDKVLVINNLLEIVDKMVITGAMAFTFHKEINPNYNIGKSLYDAEGAKIVKSIMEKAKSKGVEIILPSDYICNSEVMGKKQNNVYCDGYVKDDLIGIDVGPKTRQRINQAILSSKTIFLNGANGVFEGEAGREGSVDLINCIREATKKGAISICGGGDTITLVNSINGANKDISHISTGGGASLELLEGKILPGIDILTNRI